MIPTGYLHPRYAESFAQFGTPRELPRSGGWILQRRIPGLPYDDAMGCYPLFACRDWEHLGADLEVLGTEFVSLALVTDPFGDYRPADLVTCFDLVIPFKEHFVVDLQHPLDLIIDRRLRKQVRRARRDIDVEQCQDPAGFLDEWLRLYAVLVERHNLTGIKAFSPAVFAKQLSTPGVVLFRAVADGVTVGADWYYEQEEVAYGHLAAFSPAGYRLGAAAVLQAHAVEHFAGRLRWIDLGAGAGSAAKNDDGLSRFKRRWSTGARTAYFCGRVFDERHYAHVVAMKGSSVTTYFPAYRQGELG